MNNSSTFSIKILNMWLAHGPTKSTSNKHKGLCKMPKTKVLFLATLKKKKISYFEVMSFILVSFGPSNEHE